MHPPNGPFPFSPGLNGNALGVAKNASKILYPLAEKAGRLAKKLGTAGKILGVAGIGIEAIGTLQTLRNPSATNVEKVATVATFSTGVLLVGVGTVVSAPVAITLGVAYAAVDYFFDVNSLYQSAINGLSNAFRREEYD